MTARKGLLLGVVAIALLVGYGSMRVLGQQKPRATQIAEKIPSDINIRSDAGKLPPDILPDTLSRMPRAKRDEFTTEADKQAYDRLYDSYSKLAVSRWLGPTGIRIHIPDLAWTYFEQINLFRKRSGLEPKYYELVVAVAERESDNKQEWLNHEPDRTRLLGPRVEEVLRKNLDTTGLEEKEAVIIRFGRDLFQAPIVSSKTFADMERNFGRNSTLAATLIMCYYNANQMLLRAYDQHMDTSAECSGEVVHQQAGYHTGCLNAKNAHNAW